MIQSVLNFSKSSVHGRNPAEVFGLFNTEKPLNIMVVEYSNSFSQMRVPQEVVEKQLEEFRSTLDVIHQEVNDVNSRRRGQRQHEVAKH